MKRFRIVILLLTVFILTGCSGTYTLNINEDLSIKEELDVKIKNKTFEESEKIFTENDIDKDKYKIVSVDDGVKIQYNETYESIEDYILNSKLYRLLFNDIQYNKDGKNLEVTTNGVFDLSNNNSTFVVNNYDISLLQINLNTPYKVTKNNADTFDKELIAWTLDSSTKSKNISFVLDYNRKDNSYSQIIVLVIISLIIIGSLIYVFYEYINKRKV